MGLSTQTHSINPHQRYLPLAFQVVGGQTLQVVAPSRRNRAPPGFYMLFLLNQQGVPSKARMVRLS
jgi:hypothetical protein